MSLDVLAPRQNHWERECWADEDEFTQALIDDLESSQIQSKCEVGSKLLESRLSEPREITQVDYDCPHPHAPSAGRPDITVYYEGDSLPRLHGRTLSNPFFIECKLSGTRKELVQALRYKWRNGATDLEKYAGDCVAMAEPAFFTSTSRPTPEDDGFVFQSERLLWHSGLGILRNGSVRVEEHAADVPVGLLTFNEAESVVFR
jgi:hypothetical protein